MPLSVLQQARDELLDYAGTGMSIMEQSHRGEAYDAVHREALGLVSELLEVPDTHQVLWLQGGASQQFAQVPLNLLPAGQSADYILTGVWADKAVAEARLVGSARSANGREPTDGAAIPRCEKLDLDPAAAYVHLTSNNTICGSQWSVFPQTGEVPLVADMSSDIFSRPIDIGRFGLVYAGAQKNLGPSGVTLVIVRRDLLARAPSSLPRFLRYATHAEAGSLYHTPPCFAVYLVRGVLRGLREAGGIERAQALSKERARRVYGALEARPGVYSCPVAKRDRSLMNVVFRLPTAELEARFLALAAERRLVGLKGHRMVGGIRASLYNAVTLEAVDALCELIATFEA